MDDVTLTRKAASEIFRGRGAPKSTVNVNVVDGVVSLRGEVKRPGESEVRGAHPEDVTSGGERDESSSIFGGNRARSAGGAPADPARARSRSCLLQSQRQNAAAADRSRAAGRVGRSSDAGRLDR